MRIFLGGTCNNSKWRKQIIPLLKINYFDPVVDDWNEGAREREEHAKETCDFLLFTITPEMTGVYSIAEVVDASNKFPERTILCLMRTIDARNHFNDSSWESLRAVSEIVRRNGGQVFYNLRDVADYVNSMRPFAGMHNK